MSLMSSENASSVFNLYESFLASREEKSHSNSKRELLFALSEGLSTYSSSEASLKGLLNILQDLCPKSAGEDCFTECVALYLQFYSSNPEYSCRAANDTIRSSIHQILDLVSPFAQQSQIRYSETEMKKALQDCKNPRNAETCLHTVIIAFMILTSESAPKCDLNVNYCCEILATIQRLSRKAFVKYFRSYLLWYLDERSLIRSVDNTPRLLFRDYLKMCPDLVNAECYDDLLTTATRTTLEILALRRMEIKSQQIDSLIERILELAPLSFAVKIILGSFYTLKTSRIRISAIHFMEIVLAGAYRIEHHLVSTNKIETSQSYTRMIDRAMTEINDDVEFCGQHNDNTISEGKLRGEFQSIRLQCQVCLTDAGIAYSMILNVL